ncbi:MAG: PepSY domain-containing protein [Pseudomonadota bacterium]|nr:PepSY domain-containing protein [Pseudomonadota bacterium]
MRIPSLLLRRIHKWIGLVIGLQFVIWSLSGAMMAWLDMDEVAGGASRPAAAAPALPAPSAWPILRRQLDDIPLTGVIVRPLLGRHVFEVTTPVGAMLFDAATGRRVRVDAALARSIAAAAYAGNGDVIAVRKIPELTLAVREHQLPIWRIDFADEEISSYYVSASTGQLLERRNDSWRLWDFFWMLHNMDYVNRTSFNHPLIITVAFAMIWLAITGFYLLFRTAWKPDLRALKRLVLKRRAG